MSPTLTIAHVSDLHLDPKRLEDQLIVINALFDDIKAYRASGVTFDLVIFSGDLVQAGSDNSCFTIARDRFLTPLMVACDLPTDRLVIVPGNHDIDTSKIEEDGNIYEEGLQHTLVTRDTLNSFIERTSSKPSPSFIFALGRVYNYENLVRSIKRPDAITSNEFVKTRKYIINGTIVGIAEISSCWRSTGKRTDKNRLLIGERVIDWSVRDLSDADIKIAVFHHPLEWLAEFDASTVDGRIYGNFDIICTGHTHRSLPEYRQSPLGSAIISQAGSIYPGERSHFNGYHLIEWFESDRKVRFTARSYSDNPRRQFVPAESLAPAGVVEFSVRPRANGGNLSEFELFLRQARPTIRRNANAQVSFGRTDSTDTDEDIKEVFVCPPLRRWQSMRAEDAIAPHQRDLQGASKAAVSAEDILLGSGHVVLVGQGETGRTTLIHYLAVRVAEGVCDTPRIPAVINVAQVVKTGNYESSIRSYLSDMDVKPRKTSEAVRKLNWFICLDDFDSKDAKHISLLSSTLSSFKNHRLAIVVRAYDANLVEKILDGAANIYEICFLTRKEIRLLTQRRFKSPTSDDSVDDNSYHNVMRHINDSGLPRTGYITTLLLWAEENAQIYGHINEAILLENIVSFLLGKNEFEAALRDKFDPRAQEFLLRSIAKIMRDGDGWVQSNDLLSYVIGYFKDRGLGFGARQVIDSFIECRILIESEGYISFRYPVYQQYFYALDMSMDDDLRKSIFSGNDILDFAREIDLWSSLTREMHGVATPLLNLIDHFSPAAPSLVQNLGKFSFKGGGVYLNPARVRKILENPLTKDQVDEVLDQIDRLIRPHALGRGQDIDSLLNAQEGIADRASLATTQQEPAREASIRDFLRNAMKQRQALTLLGAVIKNCDHEAVENKRATTQMLLERWSKHLMFIADKLQEFCRDIELPKESKISRSDIMHLIDSLCIIGLSMDLSYIGSAISGHSIREICKLIAFDLNNDEGARLIAALVYSDTWSEEGIKLVGQFSKEMKNRALKQMLLEKMLSDYQLMRYRRTSEARFRELIVDTEVALGRPASAKGQRVDQLAKAAEERRA